MSEVFITTLRATMQLPEDIELVAIRIDSELNYALLQVGIEGKVIPAAVSFRPARIDFYPASLGDKLEGLLVAQAGALDYNIALTLPLPYYDFKTNEGKIRRIVHQYSKL